MRNRLFTLLIVISFLFCGLGMNSFAQDKKEHKNTRIEGKTEHTNSQLKSTKNTVLSDSVKIKAKGKNSPKVIVTDKEVGKTDDGKIIYEGPKGGKYYLNDKGKKVYIKDKAKTKNK